METSNDNCEVIKKYFRKMREYTIKLKDHNEVVAEKVLEVQELSFLLDRIEEEMDEINEKVVEQLQKYDEHNEYVDISLFIELEKRSEVLIEERNRLNNEREIINNWYVAAATRNG
jgi:hypothetical protein